MSGKKGEKFHFSWFNRAPDISSRVFHPGLRHLSRLNTKPKAWIRPDDSYPDAQLKLGHNRFTSHAQLLMHLSNAKNTFSRQLPNMGAGYIARLVFDVEAETVMILHQGKFQGGICSRLFPKEEFVEIVFCAVEMTLQARGYGRLAMNFLKCVLQTHELYDILTCADNEAVTYFKKQGFNSKEILMDPKRWVGCIKDYEGITLVHCHIQPDVDYMRMPQIIKEQIQLLSKKTGYKINQMPNEFDFRWDGYRQRPTFISIPLPKLLQNALKKKAPRDYAKRMEVIRSKIIKILTKMKEDESFGPTFMRPVTEDIAPGYFNQIQKPMDFLTIEKRLMKFPDYYKHPILFARDIRLMCMNCQRFNAADTIFFKQANDAMTLFKELYHKEFPDYPLDAETSTLPPPPPPQRNVK